MNNDESLNDFTGRDKEMAFVDEGLDFDNKYSEDIFQSENIQSEVITNTEGGLKPISNNILPIQRKEDEGKRISTIFNGENMETVLFSPKKNNTRIKVNSNPNILSFLGRGGNSIGHSSSVHFKKGAILKKRFFGFNDFYNSSKSKMSMESHDYRDFKRDSIIKQKKKFNNNTNYNNMNRNNSIEEHQLNDLDESSISLISYGNKEGKEFNTLLNYSDDSVLYPSNQIKNEIVQDYDVISVWKNRSELSSYEEKFESTLNKKNSDSKPRLSALMNPKMKPYNSNSIFNYLNIDEQESYRLSVRDRKGLNNPGLPNSSEESNRKSNRIRENPYSLLKKSGDNLNMNRKSSPYGSVPSNSNINSNNILKDGNVLNEVRIIEAINEKIEDKTTQDPKEQLECNLKNDFPKETPSSNYYYKNNPHYYKDNENQDLKTTNIQNDENYNTNLGLNNNINQFNVDNYIRDYNNSNNNNKYVSYANDNFSNNNNFDQKNNYYYSNSKYDAPKNNYNKSSPRHLYEIVETSKEEKSMMISAGFVLNNRGSQLVEIKAKSIATDLSDKIVNMPETKNYENVIFKNLTNQSNEPTVNQGSYLEGNKFTQYENKPNENQMLTNDGPNAIKTNDNEYKTKEQIAERTKFEVDRIFNEFMEKNRSPINPQPENNNISNNNYIPMNTNKESNKLLGTSSKYSSDINQEQIQLKSQKNKYIAYDYNNDKPYSLISETKTVFDITNDNNNQNGAFITDTKNKTNIEAINLNQNTNSYYTHFNLTDNKIINNNTNNVIKYQDYKELSLDPNLNVIYTDYKKDKLMDLANRKLSDVSNPLNYGIQDIDIKTSYKDLKNELFENNKLSYSENNANNRGNNLSSSSRRETKVNVNVNKQSNIITSYESRNEFNQRTNKSDLSASNVIGTDGFLNKNLVFSDVVSIVNNTEKNFNQSLNVNNSNKKINVYNNNNSSQNFNGLEVDNKDKSYNDLKDQSLNIHYKRKDSACSNINSIADDESFSSKIKNIEDNLKNEVNNLMELKSSKLINILETSSKNLLKFESKEQQESKNLSDSQLIPQERTINNHVGSNRIDLTEQKNLPSANLNTNLDIVNKSPFRVENKYYARNLDVSPSIISNLNSSEKYKSSNEVKYASKYIGSNEKYQANEVQSQNNLNFDVFLANNKPENIPLTRSNTVQLIAKPPLYQNKYISGESRTKENFNETKKSEISNLGNSLNEFKEVCNYYGLKGSFDNKLIEGKLNPISSNNISIGSSKIYYNEKEIVTKNIITTESKIIPINVSDVSNLQKIENEYKLMNEIVIQEPLTERNYVTNNYLNNIPTSDVLQLKNSKIINYPGQIANGSIKGVNNFASKIIKFSNIVPIKEGQSSSNVHSVQINYSQRLNTTPNKYEYKDSKSLVNEINQDNAVEDIQQNTVTFRYLDNKNMNVLSGNSKSDTNLNQFSNLTEIKDTSKDTYNPINSENKVGYINPQEVTPKLNLIENKAGEKVLNKVETKYVYYNHAEKINELDSFNFPIRPQSQLGNTFNKTPEAELNKKKEELENKKIKCVKEFNNAENKDKNVYLTFKDSNEINSANSHFSSYTEVKPQSSYKIGTSKDTNNNLTSSNNKFVVYSEHNWVPERNENNEKLFTNTHEGADINKNKYIGGYHNNNINNSLQSKDQTFKETVSKTLNNFYENLSDIKQIPNQLKNESINNNNCENKILNVSNDIHNRIQDLNTIDTSNPSNVKNQQDFYDEIYLRSKTPSLKNNYYDLLNQNLNANTNSLNAKETVYLAKSNDLGTIHNQNENGFITNINVDYKANDFNFSNHIYSATPQYNHYGKIGIGQSSNIENVDSNTGNIKPNVYVSAQYNYISKPDIKSDDFSNKSNNFKDFSGASDNVKTISTEIKYKPDSNDHNTHQFSNKTQANIFQNTDGKSNFESSHAFGFSSNVISSYLRKSEFHNVYKKSNHGNNEQNLNFSNKNLEQISDFAESLENKLYYNEPTQNQNIKTVPYNYYKSRDSFIQVSNKNVIKCENKNEINDNSRGNSIGKNTISNFNLVKKDSQNCVNQISKKIPNKENIYNADSNKNKFDKKISYSNMIRHMNKNTTNNSSKRKEYVSLNKRVNQVNNTTENNTHTSYYNNKTSINGDNNKNNTFYTSKPNNIPTYIAGSQNNLLNEYKKPTYMHKN